MPNKNNDIESVVEQINERLGKGRSGDNNSGGGLVFEFVPEKEEEEIEKTPEAPMEIKAEEPKEELSVPDVFELADRPVSDGSESADSRPKIWTTYVPRFTEVSETYRMINDPRPRSKRLEREEERVEKIRVAPQGFGEIKAEEPVEDTAQDPTAELDENNYDAVLLRTSSSKEESDPDTLNVYKFSENKEEPSEQKERTVEDERAEMRRLFLKDEPIEEEPEEAPVAEPEPVEEQEPKTYTIPDPDSGLRVVDFSDSGREEIAAPDGVSEFSPNMKRIHSEFVHPAQRDSFKDRFLDSLMSVRIRLGALAFFALLLLAFETAFTLGWFANAQLALLSYPGAAAMIDLLLSAAIFALTIPETVRAFKRLATGNLVTELFTVVAFAVLCLYSLTVFFFGAVTDYALFGFVFSVYAASSVLATHSRIVADFEAFKLISQNGEKQILDKRMTRSLPSENYALDGLVDEYKSRTARIFRASFISDFFKRAAKSSEKNSHNALVLSLAFGVSLVLAVVSFFVLDGFLSSVTSFALCFLLGAPAFSILSHKLPYSYAQRAAISEDSAVIGENACYDFSEIDVIAFEDSEIFGPDDVNLKRFMLYGDRDNMENVMRQMCSLFSVVGGPLNFIFAGALDNRVRHNPAENVVIEEDGLSGDVSGKRIFAGSEDYMLRNGIAIPEGAARAERGIDTTKVMYAAENGEVYAKFYIRYSFSEEFTMLLPSLKDEGIIPLIYTSDPNISNDLLKTLTAGSDCMRAMRRLTPGTTDDKLYSRVSASTVTTGDKINAINIILLAKKYKKLSKRLSVSELYATVFGIGGAAVLTFVGIPPVWALLFGAWHIAWCAILAFAGKRTFLGRKTNGKNSENN